MIYNLCSFSVSLRLEKLSVYLERVLENPLQLVGRDHVVHRGFELFVLHIGILVRSKNAILSRMFIYCYDLPDS